MALFPPFLTGRLARVTTSGRRIRELDGLRFVAVVAVLLQHCYQDVAAMSPGLPDDQFTILVRDLRVGVELFFLISGFILALPFAGHFIHGDKPVGLRQYYLRRLTRLEPPYLVTLFAWFAVLVLYWHESAASLWKSLVCSVFYVHNFFFFRSPAGSMSWINPVAWSLEVEVQFYVMAPLLFTVLFRIKSRLPRRAAIVAAAVFFSLAVKFLLSRHVPLPPTVFDYLPLFLMGTLLADVYLTDWDSNPPQSRWFDAVAVPGWLLLPLFFQHVGTKPHAFIPASTLPVALVVLCWASFRSVYTRRFLASPFVMTVGGMCYSVYLLHFWLFRILSQYSPASPTRWLSVNTLVYFVVWGP